MKSVLWKCSKHQSLFRFPSCDTDRCKSANVFILRTVQQQAWECLCDKGEKKPVFDFRGSSVFSERETNKKEKQRDGEDERDDITRPWKQAVLHSAVQTRGSFNQNRQTGTLGGIFQSHRHGKKLIFYLSKQKMNTFSWSNKSSPFCLYGPKSQITMPRGA